MENSTLLNKNTVNTRTIGINTDMHFTNNKCFKCVQENNFGKFPFIPYLPFHYPVCNCMIFAFFQNNFTSLCNNCTCENYKLINSYNSYCINNSFSSSCKNCENKTSDNESNNITQSTSKENLNYIEEKLNFSHRCSSQMNLKKQTLDDISSKRKMKCNNDEEIVDQDITEVADKFLEEKYHNHCINENNHVNGSTFRNTFVNEEDQFKNEDNQNQSNNNEKQLLNHLLKPNTNKISVHIPEESDEFTDSENEEKVSDRENILRETFTESSKIEKADIQMVLNNIDNRAPQRNNNSPQFFPKRNSQNQNSDMEMLMIIKALVNNKYDNNSTHLNKLLNQIGKEQPSKQEQNKSPRKNNKICSSTVSLSPLK